MCAYEGAGIPLAPVPSFIAFPHHLPTSATSQLVAYFLAPWRSRFHPCGPSRDGGEIGREVEAPPPQLAEDRGRLPRGQQEPAHRRVSRQIHAGLLVLELLHVR
jgi:hypothetical protein